MHLNVWGLAHNLSYVFSYGASIGIHKPKMSPNLLIKCSLKLLKNRIIILVLFHNKYTQS